MYFSKLFGSMEKVLDGGLSDHLFIYLLIFAGIWEAYFKVILLLAWFSTVLHVQLYCIQNGHNESL